MLSMSRGASSCCWRGEATETADADDALATPGVERLAVVAMLFVMLVEFAAVEYINFRRIASVAVVPRSLGGVQSSVLSAVQPKGTEGQSGRRRYRSFCCRRLGARPM